MSLTAGAWSPEARSSSVTIPVNPADRTLLRAPAVDLLVIENGKSRRVDRDELVDWLEQGRDISVFNPTSSDVWTPEPLSPSNAAQLAYPPEGGIVTYQGEIRAVSNEARARVSSSEGTPFRLVASLDSHAALIRAAMLRHLGYTIASPKLYRKLVVRFSDLETRNEFLNQVLPLSKKEIERWLAVPLEANSLDITLQDVVLEPGKLKTPSYYWGIINAENLRGRRALRGLLVPLALLHIPENINILSWDLGQTIGKEIEILQTSAHAFNEASIDDARWAARRIARITLDQWRTFVNEGLYPSDIAELLLQKILSRRNQMVRLFRVQKELPSDLKELHVNKRLTALPGVRNGKIVQENYPGYVQRFTFGDVESPLKLEEMSRYLGMETISAGIRAATKEINEFLTIRGAQDVARAHQNDVRNAILEHISKTPDQPFIAPMKPWGGPIGGFTVTANRNVITGTYYGSDSQLQLVDNVSAQASVGYFMALDGLKKAFPGGTASAYLQRNYIHVRPVPNMKEALKTDWSWMWAPSFMRFVGKILDPKLACEQGAKACPEGEDMVAEILTDTEIKIALDKFMTEFKPGEIIMIADSLGAGTALSARVPLAALLGADPLGVTSSASFGGSAQGVVLQRTTILRNEEGFQVLQQTVKNGTVSFTFDFNFWLNALKLGYATQKGTASAKAYLLGDSPERDDETSRAQRRKLFRSLRNLFHGNSTAIVERNYQPFRLKHNVPSEAFRAKFLFWNWNKAEESHLLEIEPQEDEEKRYEPKDFRRTLYSHRLLRRAGENWYAFASDIVEAWKPGYGFNASAGGQNPSNSFFGRSRWVATSSEAETTPSRQTEPITTTEHHWQGWLLSQADLFALFDEIEKTAEPLKLGFSLINRADFTQVSQLQLYDIQTVLTVYPAGIHSIREKLRPVEDRGKEAARAIFNRLVNLEGREEFTRWCRSELGRKPGSGDGRSYHEVEKELHELLHGNGWIYDCMKPWMQETTKLLLAFPQNLEKRVKWTARLVSVLERSLPLEKLVELLGKDNYLFQVRLSGFKKGTEDANMEYYSSAAGHRDYGLIRSPFSKLVDQTKISAYEIYGRYLGEGQ